MTNINVHGNKKHIQGLQPLSKSQQRKGTSHGIIISRDVLWMSQHNFNRLDANHDSLTMDQNIKAITKY